MLVVDELGITHAEWWGRAQLFVNRYRAVFATFRQPRRGCRLNVMKPQQFLEFNQALRELLASPPG
jgi:hypothetical protein